MHVGSNECIWFSDRSVYVTFGCEVNDRLRAMFIQQTGDKARVADVSVNQKITWIIIDRKQICRISRVGQ
jgi:hypothetical protein